ncbi:hypothetical protein O6H91_20G076400 [Diphasiastrum complanatum]|uniref:Uncharacterized protein n=1 Tax=Diphasiastrum complanatum TaxID=34168 RepID=A0ACC2ARW3_DIPCM|nr:hypothetical protein O6H91_20G076400 [Diphasiastrum complanatum]
MYSTILLWNGALVSNHQWSSDRFCSSFPSQRTNVLHADLQGTLLQMRQLLQSVIHHLFTIAIIRGVETETQKQEFRNSETRILRREVMLCIVDEQSLSAARQFETYELPAARESSLNKRKNTLVCGNCFLINTHFQIAI